MQLVRDVKKGESKPTPNFIPLSSVSYFHVRIDSNSSIGCSSSQLYRLVAGWAVVKPNFALTFA